MAIAPEIPTVSFVSATGDSITVSYGTTSFGDPATGTVELYGCVYTGTDAIIDTKTTIGQSEFTWTGLTPGTTYAFKAKADNGYQSTAFSDELLATTQGSVALYGSVNNQTKRVKKLYGSVNGQTKLIKKLYGSVNGETKLVYEA